MTKYFKKSYQHNKVHHDSIDNNHHNTSHYNKTHSDKHKHKSHNTNDQVYEIIGQTCTPKITKAETEDRDQHDSNSLDSNIDSSSDSK